MAPGYPLHIIPLSETWGSPQGTAPSYQSLPCQSRAPRVTLQLQIHAGREVRGTGAAEQGLCPRTCSRSSHVQEGLC